MKTQKAGDALPATVSNEDSVNTQITKRFVFKNKKLLNAMEDHNEEDAVVESTRALAAYKRNRGIP